MADFRAVSLSLQELATMVDDFLFHRADGERVPFVLLLNIDDVTQYVANVDRSDGVDMVKDLLQRWGTPLHADYPAHLNPDLNPPS